MQLRGRNLPVKFWPLATLSVIERMRDAKLHDDESFKRGQAIREKLTNQDEVGRLQMG